MKGVVQNSFKLNLTIMKIIGLYPFDKCPRLYTFYSYFIYTCAMLPASLLGSIQLIFQKDETGVRYDDLPLIVMIFLSPKLFSVLINGHNIKKCIHFFDRPVFKMDTQNYPEIEECVKICKRNSNVFFIGCVLSVSSWIGSFYFRNTEKHQLPLNVWHPSHPPEIHYWLYTDLVVGSKNIDAMTIILVLVILGVIYVGLACASVDPLIAGLICHASGQVKVVKKNLQRLDKSFHKTNSRITKSKFTYNQIKKCVRHYSAIVAFVDEYESCFSSAIIWQVVESVVVIGICCLQISKIQDFNINFVILANYLCCLLVQVYFYCYYGATLIDENHSLTKAIYMSDWYTYNEESKKALIILMERSKKPLTVCAGKILDLSLETFMLILKRSYSLLAVLKNY